MFPSMYPAPLVHHVGLDAPAPIARVWLDAEEWLRHVTATQTEHEHSPVWCKGWRRKRGVPVRSAEHLAVLISTTSEPNQFGGVELPNGDRWAQVMRTDEAWFVEVRGTGDDWPHRVFRDGPDGYPGPLPDDNPLCAQELVGSMLAADIAWSWVKRGTLPEGFSRTLNYRH